MPAVTLVAALAANGVIGRDNGLPWQLPGDLAHFKRVTMGKPIVMGRRTFESIGRALPGRSNLVVSRNRDFRAPGCRILPSLQAALAAARDIALADGAEEIAVIGGAQIYAAALPLAERLQLTEVHARVAGDTWFPQVDWTLWREVRRQRFAAQPPNPHAYSFVEYRRC